VQLDPYFLVSFFTDLLLCDAFAAVDLTQTHQVHQSEFRDFILHMAAADLHSRKVMHDPSQAGDWVKCTLESDDEIQERLKSWVDNIMLRRYR
jgi:hypothetical protein